MPPLEAYTGPPRTSGEITKFHLVHVFQAFHEFVMTPEGRKRLKDAVAAKRKPEDETAAILREKFLTVGFDGDYGMSVLKRAHQDFQDDPFVMQLLNRFAQLDSLVCDQAELSPEDFAKKLQGMREQQMRTMKAHYERQQQMQRQQAVDPAERQRILEAARQAQARMAAMTPEQRAMMAKMAQQQMAEIRTANPNMTQQEMSRLVSARMQDLQKLVSTSGVMTPELEAAMSKLNTLVAEASSAAEAPATGAPPPSSKEDEDEELMMRPTLDRS